MLTPDQLKEHILNRTGYGISVWASDRYDSLGPDAYIAEQLSGSLPPISELGTNNIKKVFRGAHSERQLEAVLLDFWFNHFNVDAIYQREHRRVEYVVGRKLGYHQNEAILPYMLGDFGQMLLETARSPSMLSYLNNDVNFEYETVDGVSYGGNDNYGREVMELHTVGVDGGYDEQDIKEAARIMTGWTLNGDEFQFQSARHDYGEKTVMGRVWPAGRGRGEGERFLQYLAEHRSTARFLSGKLVSRLVNEDRPASIWGAAEAAFLPNQNLKDTTSAILNHPDFRSETHFRSKFKQPHRYAASCLMAMGAEPDDWGFAEFKTVSRTIHFFQEESGETPYTVGPPTGYPDESSYWVAPTAMLDRVGVAHRISHYRDLRDALIARTGINGRELEETVDLMIPAMIPGGVSEETRNYALDHAAVNAINNAGRISMLAHALLCSPEFVRH